MRYNYASPPPISVQKLPFSYGHVGETLMALYIKIRKVNAVFHCPLPYILVSVAMIFSLKFKVLYIQNECWRYIYIGQCVPFRDLNIYPAFSGEYLTWHCTKFKRLEFLHKDKCWKFSTSVSPCGKIMWFTEHLKIKLKHTTCWKQVASEVLEVFSSATAQQHAWPKYDWK